jgi:hypothetical protein
MTGHDFAPHVKDFFSTDVENIVYDLCTEAIPEALRRLADDLISSSRKLRRRSAKQITVLREIRRDPSFADRRGVVAFRRVGGKIELGATPTGRSDEYRRQLDRAVTRIQSSSIISRIHNRDPELAILFAEYDQELSSNTPNASAVSLWIIGQDIDNRIRLGQSATDEDQNIGNNTLRYLMTFLTAHNLYLQSFAEIEQLSKDLDRSTSLYQGLDERARSAPWSLLEALSADNNLFETRTQRALEKAASAIDRPDSDKTKGLVGLGLGLLRGALRIMGATALEKMLDPTDTALFENAAESLDKLLSEPGLEREIIIFCRAHKAKYWSWRIGYRYSSTGSEFS